MDRSGGEGEKGRERERYRVRKADMGMGNCPPQHALIDILVITADEHK